MGWDGIGYDGMGWDGMGWDRMGWDGDSQTIRQPSTHRQRETETDIQPDN